MGRRFVKKILFILITATTVGCGSWAVWNFSYVKVVVTQRPTVSHETPICPVVADTEEHLVIPDLGINAPLVVPIEPTEQATEEALELGISYYPNSPQPGDGTNVIVTGHSSAPVFYGGNYKTVFAQLDKLKPGVPIYLHHRGAVFLYEVAEQMIVAPNDLSVLDQTSDERLTLITCWPPGTTWKRRVVVAKRVF